MEKTSYITEHMPANGCPANGYENFYLHDHSTHSTQSSKRSVKRRQEQDSTRSWKLCLASSTKIKECMSPQEKVMKTIACFLDFEDMGKVVLVNHRWRKMLCEKKLFPGCRVPTSLLVLAEIRKYLNDQERVANSSQINYDEVENYFYVKIIFNNENYCFDVVNNIELTRLAKLAHVTRLPTLKSHHVTDSALNFVLSQFTGLQDLLIDSHFVTNVSLRALKNHTDLINLSILDCKITDAGLSALVGLTSLRSLKIRLKNENSDVNDDVAVTAAGLAQLRHLPLEKLSFHRFFPKNIDQLKCISTLQDLTVFPSTGIKASQFSRIGKLTRLRSLSLRYSEDDGLSLYRFRQLIRLQSLYLYKIKIYDHTLDELTYFTALKKLELRECEMSSGNLDACVAELRNRLSNTVIGYYPVTGI